MLPGRTEDRCSPARSAAATTRPPCCYPSSRQANTRASSTRPAVDDRGDAARARLLRDALRLSFRATAARSAPSRSSPSAPRNYQLVPLMMAAAQDTTRLLIADGVGIGKTIEAGLIAAELLATGDAERLAVLCSPQLAPQWQAELRTKFGINAELLLPSTANRLARSVPFGSTIYEHYPYLIDLHRLSSSSTAAATSSRLLCPELVIVDEAHTCIAPAGRRILTGAPALHAAAPARRRPDPAPAAAHRNPAQRRRRRLAVARRAARPPARRASRRPVRHRHGKRTGSCSRSSSFSVSAPTSANTCTRTPRSRPGKPRKQSYRLTPEYRTLFDDVMAYAREHVTDPTLNHVHRRVRWWSAIALLRCLASSPAAAEQTLLNRSDLKPTSTAPTPPTQLAGPRVFDTDLDDTTEGEDAALGADTSNDQSPDATARRRLRAFAAEAAALRGANGDAKLKRAIAIINSLVQTATTRSCSADTSRRPNTSPSTSPRRSPNTIPPRVSRL